MSGYWVLKDNEPIKATLKEWAEFFESPGRFVGDITINGVRIVTIFSGHDCEHELGLHDGPPLLFSTKIFGGAHDGEETFYATYEEAQAGHCVLVELVQAEGR